MLWVPYLGKVPVSFEEQIRQCVQNTYGCINPIIIYSTFRALMARKDPLPIQQRSCIIYQFECQHCDGSCIGKTHDHLGVRIRQHIPLAIVPPEVKASCPRRGRPPKMKQPVVASRVDTNITTRPRRGRPPTKAFTTTDYSSSNAKYLVQNPTCLSKYTDKCFSIVTRARSKSHSNALEAVHISHSGPYLCVQKQFVQTLLLFSRCVLTLTWLWSKFLLHHGIVLSSFTPCTSL